MATLSLPTIAATKEELISNDIEVALPDFEALKKISSTDRQTYFLGLRQILIELSDQMEASEFADASFDADAGGGFDSVANTFYFLKKAYAAEVGAQCIYAGHLMNRAAGAPCPRPGNGSCNSGYVECNPYFYGPKVCVSPGKRATRSCEASARPANAIFEFQNKNPTIWENQKKEIAAYCKKGQQVAICRLLRLRLSELKQTLSTTDAIPVQPPERISGSRDWTAGRRVVGGVILTPERKGCYPEAVVAGYRCGESSPIAPLVDVETIYRGICEADSEYLKQERSRIEGQIQNAIRCSRSAAAASGPKYLKVKYSEQTRRAESALQTFKKCFQMIQTGHRLPSEDTGEIEFINQSEKVRIKSSKAGRETVTDRYHFAMTINLLTHWGMNPYLCDYKLVTPSGLRSPKRSDETRSTQ